MWMQSLVLSCSPFSPHRFMGLFVMSLTISTQTIHLPRYILLTTNSTVHLPRYILLSTNSASMVISYVHNAIDNTLSRINNEKTGVIVDKKKFQITILFLPLRHRLRERGFQIIIFCTPVPIYDSILE